MNIKNMSIKDIEIQLWEKFVSDMSVKVEKVNDSISDDPYLSCLDVHRDFSNLLEAYSGEERLDPKFIAQAKVLSLKERRAKKRLKTWNLNALLNEEHHMGRLISEAKNKLFFLKKGSI